MTRFVPFVCAGRKGKIFIVFIKVDPCNELAAGGYLFLEILESISSAVLEIDIIDVIEHVSVVMLGESVYDERGYDNVSIVFVIVIIVDKWVLSQYLRSHL